MASLEIVVVIALSRAENPEGVNVTVRGLSPVGLKMRETTRIQSGRWFQQGRREVVVGSEIAKNYPDAALGSKLKFGRGEWDVVGVFESPEPARNSEIMADSNLMATDFGREEVLSSALVRATDEVALQALRNEFSSDKRLQLDVDLEKEFYERQTSTGNVVKYLGTFVAFIMAIGSCFAAMNTMYAAVARRSKEIGTLRVLGFTKPAILVSFFLESVFLAVLGGLLGILLVLPLNNLTTNIGAGNFNQIAFQLKVTPPVMMRGLLFALFMGALGGLLPAASAARKQILVALREI
jgi:ABC-type antimicrobial peptide transport system permease subunit